MLALGGGNHFTPLSNCPRHRVCLAPVGDLKKNWNRMPLRLHFMLIVPVEEIMRVVFPWKWWACAQCGLCSFMQAINESSLLEFGSDLQSPRDSEMSRGAFVINSDLIGGCVKRKVKRLQITCRVHACYADTFCCRKQVPGSWLNIPAHAQRQLLSAKIISLQACVPCNWRNRSCRWIHIETTLSSAPVWFLKLKSSNVEVFVYKL